MHMPIAYAINNGYTKPLMAQLIVLFERAKPTTIYDIYILNYGLSQTNRAILTAHVSTLNAQSSLIFLDISKEYFEQIPMIAHWGKETNYRGLLALLAPELERILYLDADTMVLEDLSHLMEIKLDDHPFAASVDVASQHQNMLRIAQADANLEAEAQLFTFGYINAGVMLINLRYWRQHNWSHEFLRLLNLTKDFYPALYPDQDVLNYMAIADGINKIYYLPSTYNSLYAHQVPSFEQNRVATGMARTVSEIRSHAEIHRRNQWVTNPEGTLIFDKVVIIHFVSLKPWHPARTGDDFVAIFRPYADRVGLEIPPLGVDKYKVKNFGELRIKLSRLSRYKGVLWMLALLNVTIVLLLSLLLSRVI